MVGDPTDEDRVYHVPPAHDLVPGMMEELCGFANGGGAFVHPVIRAIAVHYMIGHIHPFVDGNGRLARALFRRQMIGCGYRMFELVPVSAAIWAHRAGYGRAYRYTETDGGDLTYFIQFILGCIRELMEMTDMASEIPNRTVPDIKIESNREMTSVDRRWVVANRFR